MKSISQKLQNDIRKIMQGSVDEALVGGQVNIDKNHSGKIDAQDFKILKGKKAAPVKEETVEEAANRAQQAAIAISLIKAGKKDGKMPAPMKEEQKKAVSPFDWKNRPSELAKKPGELTGHESKKISTGTVYTKKPVKEEYTFADYLEAARAQYVDEDAVLVANEAFKNQDITLFNYQSQSPEA